MRQLISRLSRRLLPPLVTIDGYEQPELIEVIFKKTVAYRPLDAWPEMAGVPSVLDFGGGCGVHYKAAKRHSPDVRWAVVDTPAMVARASELATDNLRFFASVSEAKEWLGPVAVMHSDGALQYTPDPIATLTELCRLRAGVMIWKRLCLSGDTVERTVETSQLIHSGPGQIFGIKNKAVNLGVTTIPERVFLEAHREYEIKSRIDNSYRFRLRD